MRRGLRDCDLDWGLVGLGSWIVNRRVLYLNDLRSTIDKLEIADTQRNEAVRQRIDEISRGRVKESLPSIELGPIQDSQE